MAFTNFCCRNGGSNLNAGTRTGDTTVPGTAADLTYAAGGWVNATRVFTVASGDPVADGVAVGDHVALDTGGSTAVYMGQVSARTTTTITIHATNNSGTNPANGTYTLRVGGAWSGPTGGSGVNSFPFNILRNAQGTSGTLVRVNLMNDKTYSITAAITIPNSITIHTIIHGFASAYDDGGRATIDGGTSGASYNLIDDNSNQAGTIVWMRDLILQNNGATGSSSAVSFTSVDLGLWERVSIKNIRGSGFALGNTLGQVHCVECEAYNCNQSNTANLGGFSASSFGGLYVRCISHGHTAGSNAHGWRLSGTNSLLVDCISAGNSGSGVNMNGGNYVHLIGCVIYGNAVGVNATAQSCMADSCIFESNTGAVFAETGTQFFRAWNCAYYNNGSISAANVVDETNCISLSASALIDPANGDYRVKPRLWGAGRGYYLQGEGHSKQTVTYPNIGTETGVAFGAADLIKGRP